MTAAVLYGLAAVSDILDGYLARKLNQSSELGKIIDPIADKLIVGVTLVFFAFKRIFPPILVIIFVLKELLMLLIGFLFLLKGIKIISSRIYGKVAMVLTSISILMALLQIPLSVLVFIVGLFFSVFAGLDYLYYYLKVLKK
jgi:Phosphatidylglycerophosphate synthase